MEKRVEECTGPYEKVESIYRNNKRLRCFLFSIELFLWYSCTSTCIPLQVLLIARVIGNNNNIINYYYLSNRSILKRGFQDILEHSMDYYYEYFIEYYEVLYFWTSEVLICFVPASSRN